MKKMDLILFLVSVFLFPHALLCYDISKKTNDNANSLYDPDTNRNVSELISSKGYPVENHIIQTEDGYLLSVQRIPHGKLSKETCKRKPILLQHGLLSSSSDWVINFPHQSLGFILADSGYDVWLGNARGNSYSRRHVSLEPNSTEFWNFSLDEMAEYDVPAMIDYILNKTKKSSLTYIGHSQGSTVAFAMLSEKPHYNKKVNFFVTLAPEIEIGHGKKMFLLYAAPYVNYMEGFFGMLGMNEIFPDGPAMKLITSLFCSTNLFHMCETVVFSMAGADREQLNMTRFPVYLSHYPCGASTKNFLHFFQIVRSGEFRKYDYKTENFEHYNQDTPPAYDLSKITTPIALFWGKNDALLDQKDVDILEKKLKSLVYSYCVPWKDFNHIDFLLAKDARDLVYNQILHLLSQDVDNQENEYTLEAENCV